MIRSMFLPDGALALAVVGAIWLGGPCVAQAQPESGEALYNAKCGGCHSLDANRIGPLHRGVVGRKIGSAPGYDYSPAIKKLKGAWTTVRLDKWLTDPQTVAPGAKMFFSVPDPAQRKAIIDYLAANSPPVTAAADVKAKPKKAKG